jgi:hypothetical protein
MISGRGSPADYGGARVHEGLVDVVADLPADAQAAEPVQQRDRLFDHSPMSAQAAGTGVSRPRRGLGSGLRAVALGLTGLVSQLGRHAGEC